MVGRQRKAREPKYDTANGTVGRLTGLPMPKNVPITDEGYEDFEAFFTDAGPSTRRRSSSSRAAAQATQPAADLLSKAARREARSKQNPSSVAPNFELGTVGRRTGIKMRADVPRTQEGYEDFEAFFKSPGSAASATSSAKGKGRNSRRVSSVGVGRRASVADLSTRSPAKQLDDPDEDMSEPDQDEEDTAPMPVDFEFEAGADEGPQQDSDEDPPDTQDQDPFGAESDQDGEEEERNTVAPLPNDLAPDSDSDDVHGMPAMDLPDESHHAGSSPSPHSRSASSSAKKAGKRRASSDENQDPQSPPKKAKAKKPPAKRQRKWESEEPEGIRRSSRQHIKPLEYWRNERLVYGRRQSGVQPAYGIKEIVRLPPAEHRSLVNKRGKGKRGGGGSQRGGSEQPSHAGAADEAEYEGWDDATDPDGLVWDYNSQEETHRRVAFTSKMISTKQAGKHNYRFQKVFTDGDFMACGLLEIPPNEKKPLKPSKDNTFMLFVFRGAVRVLVYRTTFTVATGGFFLVPRGNSYEIENIGMDDATVVFMQAREVRLVEDPNASLNAGD